MSRPRGGIIGAKTAWTSTATSAVWTLRQAEEMKADGKWPRGPEAPTSLTATAGDTELSLSWTAPATTHGTITNYLVEYTPSGGSAAEVLVGSAATSYQLTGLINDTEYSVRVAAISAGGQGDYSAAVTGTPASVPLITVSSNISGTGTSADPWRATNFNWREHPYTSNSRTPSPTFTAGGSVTVTILDAQYDLGREYDGESFPVHSFVYVNGSQVGSNIVVDGSGDTRTVNLNAGDVLSFRWQWDNGTNFTDAMPGGLRVYI